jgi:putative transposase
MVGFGGKGKRDAPKGRSTAPSNMIGAVGLIARGDRAVPVTVQARTPVGPDVAFAGFEADFGEQYPGAVDVWRQAWNEFIPFLDYPPELRRIVYTTNAIEPINFQLRKITKNRGHFPSDEAATKLLDLKLRNISSKR